MGSVQSLGAGSGLLTSELVEDIIAAEREATDLRIEARRVEFEARISSFGSIRASVESLRSAASSLAQSDQLLSTLARSSNESAVLAEATTEANPGVHTVEVLSLARNHTLATTRFDSPDAVVGSGTLEINFGTTTFAGGVYDSFTANPERASASVVIDDSNNTLGGIRDAINEAAIGVNASIIDDGSGFVLVLTSAESGSDNSLEINVTEGGVAGLSALAFNAGAATAGVNLTQTVAADDAVATIDGVTVRRDTNTITNVVPGVTFNALGLSVGNPVTVTVEQDNAAIVERLQSFVDSFNELRTLTDELTAFDEDAGSGALLIGDTTLRGIRNQLRRFLSSQLDTASGSSLRALVDIGLETNQNNNFALELDVSRLQEALTSNPRDVQALLADRVVASDELVRVTGFQNSTEAGQYDVQISQIATQGRLVGVSVASLAGPITIDDDNDNVSLTVDGVQAALTLTQGTFADGAALAQEIQVQFNQSAAAQSGGASLEVTFDADSNQLNLRSASFGSESYVAVDLLDVNTLADLGLDLDAGNDGRGVNVAGTINGVEGIGVGQFLSVPFGPVPATSGFYEGQSVASLATGPIVIDADNGVFSLDVDGVASGQITLTPGTYADGAELAAEIQTQLDADSALSDASVGIEVRFDSARSVFEFRSNSTGLQSRVSVVGGAANVATDLGLTVAAGTPGRIASSVADAASGLQLQILGGETGPRGQAGVVRGILNQFDRYLDDILSLDGAIQTRLNTLEGQIDELDAESQDFGDRIDALEARLRTQFAAADALISQLNSTSSFLDQQLSALPGFTNDG